MDNEELYETIVEVIKSNDYDKAEEIVSEICNNEYGIYNFNLNEIFEFLLINGNAKLLIILDKAWYMAIGRSVAEIGLCDIEDFKENIDNRKKYLKEFFHRNDYSSPKINIENRGFFDDIKAFIRRREFIVKSSIEEVILNGKFDILKLISTTFYYFHYDINHKSMLAYFTDDILPKINVIEEKYYGNLYDNISIKWTFHTEFEYKEKGKKRKKKLFLKMNILMLLAVRGYKGFIKYLIEEKGMDYAEFDKYGNSILSYALLARHKETIAYILSIDPEHFVDELLNHCGERRIYSFCGKEFENWMI